MDESTITVPTTDGLELQTYRWAPDGPPRAVVQVQHGLAEHAARYRRLAEQLTAAGYLVYAPDCRGSGRTARGAYGDWGPDGWPGWVEDLVRLNTRIHDENPGLPVALLGHSMGSFAAQHYLLEHSRDVDAVVLSGTTEVGGLAALLDSDEPADLSSFNAAFENRTGYEWLSRDEAEVDAYVADPGCGWEAPPIPGVGTLAEAADPERIAAVRDDLPVLLVSGDADPLAGRGAAIEMVAQRYRDAGLTDVEVLLYPEGRHEVFNETNRDEVTADVIAFLDRTVGAG
jgi:alpha-beta hydrolase superfamily lysophospholipase